MESFNIEDLPDDWYDAINREGSEIIQRLSNYPPQFNLIVSQMVVQTIIYHSLKKEFRQAFLIRMLDAFTEQFEEWEEEDSTNSEDAPE